jgi:polyhydroxyalkanoate synthesis regulator phasin
MEDLLKKFLHTGVGFVALAAEKIQTTVDSLVEQSKISEEEGRKIVANFMEDTEAKKTELEEKFQEVTNSLNIDFFKNKAEEVTDEMEVDVDALEDELGLNDEKIAVIEIKDGDK